MESLPATVRDGRAYFASDLFSRFALAYDMNEPAGKPVPEPTIVPGKPENTKPAKDEVTKAGTKTAQRNPQERQKKLRRTGPHHPRQEMTPIQICGWRS